MFFVNTPFFRLFFFVGGGGGGVSGYISIDSSVSLMRACMVRRYAQLIVDRVFILRVVHFVVNIPWLSGSLS